MVKSSASLFLDPNWFAQTSSLNRWEEVKIWEPEPANRASSKQNPIITTASFPKLDTRLIPTLGISQTFTLSVNSNQPVRSLRDFLNVPWHCLLMQPYETLQNRVSVLGSSHQGMCHDLCHLWALHMPGVSPENCLFVPSSAPFLVHFSLLPCYMSLLPWSPPDLPSLCYPLTFTPGLNHKLHEDRVWVCLFCHHIPSI